MVTCSLVHYKKYIVAIGISLIFASSSLSNSNQESKTYTVLIYMAAANDLEPFVDRNLEQMKQIGSNDNVKILVHLDTYQKGSKKCTQRFIVHRNRLEYICDNVCMDSGDEKTLVDACRWALSQHKSDYFVLVVWNHGIGPLNPFIQQFNRQHLVKYNTATKLIEIDRSLSFLDVFESLTGQTPQYRGICFDQSTGNYITEQNFRKALGNICNDYLDGKKIDVICFDACYMATAEVAFNIMPYAHYMVGSQEAVLGRGYYYERLVNPLNKGAIEPYEFACQVVRSFKETHGKITHDYAQSAICLDNFECINENINKTAELLVELLKRQKNDSVRKAIQVSSDKKHCTYFSEHSYKDYCHFSSNLYERISQCEFIDAPDNEVLIQELRGTLAAGIELISKAVIANAAGKNLAGATGLSIYLPDRKIHASYQSLDFAYNNSWSQFLMQYLAKS